MGAGETALAWLVGIGAAVAAVTAIISGIPKLWRFTRKVVATVDVIALLPDTLAAMDQRLIEHVGIAEQQRAEINTALETRSDAIDKKFRELTVLVLDVRHEVKNNGGSSMKDTLDRVEQSLTKTPTGSTVIPSIVAVVKPPTRVRKTPKGTSE